MTEKKEQFVICYLFIVTKTGNRAQLHCDTKQKGKRKETNRQT